MATFPIRASVTTSNPRALSDSQVNGFVSSAYQLFNRTHPFTTGAVSITRSGNAVTVAFDANFAGPVTQTVANQFQALLQAKLRDAFPRPSASRPTPSAPPTTTVAPPASSVPATTSPAATGSKVSIPILVGVGVVTLGLVYGALVLSDSRRRTGARVNPSRRRSRRRY